MTDVSSVVWLLGRDWLNSLWGSKKTLKELTMSLLPLFGQIGLQLLLRDQLGTDSEDVVMTLSVGRDRTEGVNERLEGLLTVF